MCARHWHTESHICCSSTVSSTPMRAVASMHMFSGRVCSTRARRRRSDGPRYGCHLQTTYLLTHVYLGDELLLAGHFSNDAHCAVPLWAQSGIHICLHCTPETSAAFLWLLLHMQRLKVRSVVCMQDNYIWSEFPRKCSAQYGWRNLLKAHLG